MARWLFTFQVVWHLRGIEACCDQQIRVSGEVPNNSQVAAIFFTRYLSPLRPYPSASFLHLAHARLTETPPVLKDAHGNHPGTTREFVDGSRGVVSALHAPICETVTSHLHFQRLRNTSSMRCRPRGCLVFVLHVSCSVSSEGV